jgi:hypothetical protein
MSYVRVILVFPAMVALISCSGTRSYVNPDADMGYYRRIGVVTFQSLTDDPRAGQKLQRILVTELLKRGDMEVIQAGQVEKIETDVRNKQSLPLPAALDSTSIKMLGEQAGAQGILVGTVREFRMERVGQEEFPLVAISLQLIDAPTGRIVWDVSVGERGGPKFPVFSFGETHTLTELATKLCRKALGTMP